MFLPLLHSSGKVQEAIRSFRELQDQLEGVTVRMQQLQPQCAELKNQAQTCSRVHKTAETNLRDLEKDTDQLNKRIQELKHRYFKSLAKGNSFMSHPSSFIMTQPLFQPIFSETHAPVERINHIQAELEDQSFQDSTLFQQIGPFKQACTASKEKTRRQLHEARDNFNKVRKQVRGLKAFIHQLTEVMNTKHCAYNERRKYLSVRCKWYFDSMLFQGGYVGKIAFDHKNETLSISVQPGEGGKADVSDMRSLSGGERSFSTVCFLLSLWEIAEVPFCALYAFDVDMDMVNRRISMDMMLNIAARQRYRQFIFFTPQSVSSLPVNNLVRIIRLIDPDSSQSALPFTQRNSE
ncbi:structural maintenance of chromosomes protein 6-like [Garra rufa]|uniref:structural maintenance of chromosomes protein 6-like n=1 Tax=Garra rufa TaxID=137080 RepID=UPI003CCEDFC4